jgi:propanol-preferring alcohol dehydrogenase
MCGSDLHHLYRVPRKERSKPFLGINVSPDIIPGHEPAGIVTKIGSDVQSLEKGNRVVVHHISGCGHCKYCQGGHVIHCEKKKTYGYDVHGAFADFMVALEKDCVILPEGLSFEEGAYASCGAGTAWKASKVARLHGLVTAALFGMGPVGLAGVVAGKALGAKIIGVEVSEERIELAKKAGADHVINARETDSVKEIFNLTNGEGADVAIDYSGNPLARNNALNCLKVFGRMVFVGMGSLTTIDPTNQIIQKELTISGSWVFTTFELQEMLDAMERYDIHFNQLITHRFSIEEAPEALELFDQGKTGKAVFMW